MTERFDKEIDAILRKLSNAEGVFAANGAASAHLDADVLAAFAENVLPEKTKAFYTEHLADCDRCRQILADIISLRSLTETKPASAENKAEAFNTAVSWYQRLFVLPKAAYALATLVLFFGGLLGFIALQYFNQKQVSQNAREMSSPIAQSEVAANTDSFSANNANLLTDTKPATVSPTANAVNKSFNTALSNSNVTRELSVKRNRRENSENEETVATVPQVAPTAETKDSNETAIGNVVSTPAANAQASEDAFQTKSMKNLPRETKKMKPPAQKADVLSDENAEKTSIGGKTFTKRNNVWVDSEYRNQVTVNISRGSGEYKNLDQNLRRIVENLSGTVIIVWQGKAYRIY